MSIDWDVIWSVFAVLIQQSCGYFSASLPVSKWSDEYLHIFVRQPNHPRLSSSDLRVRGLRVGYICVPDPTRKFQFFTRPDPPVYTRYPWRAVTDYEVGIFGQTLSAPPLSQRVHITLTLLIITLFERLAKHFHLTCTSVDIQILVELGMRKVITCISVDVNKDIIKPWSSL